MDVPRNVKGLVRLAGEKGWATEQVPLGGHFVLRLTRDGHRVAALWSEDDGFQGAYANPYAPRWPLIRFNYDQLREVLGIEPDDFEYPAFDEEPDDVRQNMQWEREYLGHYLTRHPLEFVNMRKFPRVIQADQFEELAHPGEWIELLGLVEDAEVKKSRRTGTSWARFGISDLSGIVPCFAFGKVAEGLDNGAVVHVRGKPEERDESLSLVAMKITEVVW